MLTVLIGSGPALTAADLDLCEQRVSRPIPGPYRNFLLHHNGGCPYPSDFLIPGRDGQPDLLGTVGQFLGVGMANEHAEIERCLHIYTGRVPPHYFPSPTTPVAT